MAASAPSRPIQANVTPRPGSSPVVEDRFTARWPEWKAHGATMVRDVAPFEARKLRLLNAAHYAIAYMTRACPQRGTRRPSCIERR